MVEEPAALQLFSLQLQEGDASVCGGSTSKACTAVSALAIPSGGKAAGSPGVWGRSQDGPVTSSEANRACLVWAAIPIANRIGCYLLTVLLSVHGFFFFKAEKPKIRASVDSVW